MFYDTLISPKADFNIRKKLQSLGPKKRCTGSPNFRDILRQRCRERVKSRRGALFDQMRSLNDENSVRQAISQFIEKDLKEMQTLCSLDDSTIVNESVLMETCTNVDEPLALLGLSEREKWILEEYERLIDCTNYQADLENQVTCPICLHGFLIEQGNVINCSSCSLQLPQRMSLSQLEQLIMQVVDTHGQTCPEDPKFTLCPDTTSTSLFMMCCLCDCMFQIV